MLFSHSSSSSPHAELVSRSQPCRKSIAQIATRIITKKKLQERRRAERILTVRKSERWVEGVNKDVSSKEWVKIRFCSVVQTKSVEKSNEKPSQSIKKRDQWQCRSFQLNSEVAPLIIMCSNRTFFQCNRAPKRRTIKFSFWLNILKQLVECLVCSRSVSQNDLAGVHKNTHGSTKAVLNCLSLHSNRRLVQHAFCNKLLRLKRRVLSLLELWNVRTVSQVNPKVCL